jgi:hypothetical protein
MAIAWAMPRTNKRLAAGSRRFLLQLLQERDEVGVLEARHVAQPGIFRICTKHLLKRLVE